jgi:DNA-binding HxlR family transcriptional regulator
MAAKSKPSDIFDERYPARRILKLIGDKWTPIVLYCLSGGVRRFNAARKDGSLARRFEPNRRCGKWPT